jgi:hypothetical protein
MAAARSSAWDFMMVPLSLLQGFDPVRVDRDGFGVLFDRGVDQELLAVGGYVILIVR